MKLLVVNNNVMFENPEGLFIYRGNGKFLVELSRLVDQLEFFQFRMKFGGNDCLADFNIVNRGFAIVSIPRENSKLIPYVKALTVGFRRIAKCDFLYLFYPGIICIILALFAIMQRKPFGLYVRGEKGIQAAISKYIFRRSTISLTISPRFTEMIRKASGTAETIRPMMEDGEGDIVAGRTYSAKDHYRLLYVGRIELAKGSYDLISAFQIMSDRGIRNVSLDMVGDGADLKRIKELVHNLGLGDQIALPGTISDRDVLKGYYRRADLFVLPTHHEGFPRVLYEAMIAGTPILTTFVGTIPHLMKDGYNCFQASRENPAGLADKIMGIIGNYETMARVAVNGTQTIRDYLSDKKEPHAAHLVRILAEKGIVGGRE